MASSSSRRCQQQRQRKLPLLLLAGAALVLHAATLLPVVRAGRDIHADHDLMPGWLGSDYQAPELTPGSVEGRTRNMKVLNADARIFLFEGFLTPAECDQIMSQATPRLVRSNVVSATKSDATNSTKEEMSNIRTSHGMFFTRGENQLIKTVEDRMAAWSLLPATNGEGLQVLRYENSQKYDPHWDYFFHREGVSNGGNRYATILTYLSDVEEGGETIFPFIPAAADDASMSECARKYLAVKPKKGDAILFHSISPSGAFEKRSMHGSCPVIKGTKWSMAKWIHVGPFALGRGPKVAIKQTENSFEKRDEHPGCVNDDSRCDTWSMRGECHKNAVWMVGSADKPGNCLKACERCDVWDAHVAGVSAAVARGADATVLASGAAAAVGAVGRKVSAGSVAVGADARHSKAHLQVEHLSAFER